MLKYHGNGHWESVENGVISSLLFRFVCLFAFVTFSLKNLFKTVNSNETEGLSLGHNLNAMGLFRCSGGLICLETPHC